MDTIATYQQPRILPQILSRSLQSLAPLSVVLLDANERPVPLSSAGYVLRVNKKYRLRVVVPHDKHLERARLNNPPDFLLCGEHSTFQNEHGHRTFDFPFRVRFELGRWVSSLRFDSLDAELVYSASSAKHGQRLEIPIVVRPGSLPMILGALGTVLTGVLPLLAEPLIKGEEPLADRLRGWLSSPYPYLIVLGIAVVIGGIYGWSWYQLRSRCRELFSQHLERHPVPPGA